MNESYERDLDLNLLRIFAVVAEEGSITRAASRLYVTQPAVSAALRRLSAFVGAELFTRQGRGVVLTARGARLREATQQFLQPLVAATSAVPVFDPKAATDTVRMGLSDSLETLLLPDVLRVLRMQAPSIRLIIVPVQFRSVEQLLLSNAVDFAVSIADGLPRSILRKQLVLLPFELMRPIAASHVCLYDSRFVKLPKRPTRADYFACEHVIVSYAGDMRGFVEDVLGTSRDVRVSVPSFSYVADVVDGSPLVATIPGMLAEHIVSLRPHLRIAPIPFELERANLDILWTRATDDAPAATFVRELVEHVANDIVSVKAALRPSPQRKRR